eukprot:CAMPEP_0204821524 /NCGR_PEP_ID=MMETSP1018-20131115/21640_1 /ASSEMBLY_ACC=CAM_ASM_000518 /TAXON_ID=46462 /ORGANISM="Anophryoides haemophila, Strain AH6" /LENGTH=61 /DNA_ID=CAMNT_0051934555 /DNA_START=1528 /DNA_END=1713 /DNA_ORIENTATION=+
MMYQELIPLLEKHLISMMEVNGLLICLSKMLLEMDSEEPLGYLSIMEEVLDGVKYLMEDLG